MKPDIILHKKLNAIEALEFYSRLHRQRSKFHRDNDADRSKVREYMKRTGQTDLMDLEALHDWLKSDECYDKRDFKLAVKNVNCMGTKMILDYMILGCGFVRA